MFPVFKKSESTTARLCSPFLSPSLPPSPLSFHQPIGDWGSPDGVRCKVDTQLYLVCPDHTHKENHKAIPVNNKNQESCMDMWVDSQVLEFGSLLRGCRVEVSRPGTYSLTTDWTVVILYLSHLYTEVSMRLLLNDLMCVRRTYELGIQLGVPESDLDEIEDDYRYVADRRRETLRKWERIDERPSWSKLVRALVAINERRVARNIAEKYGILHSLKYWGPDCTLGSLGLILGLSCKPHKTLILGGSAPLTNYWGASVPLAPFPCLCILLL